MQRIIVTLNDRGEVTDIGVDTGGDDTTGPRQENLPDVSDEVRQDGDLAKSAKKLLLEDNKMLREHIKLLRKHNKMFTKLLHSYVSNARYILEDKRKKKDKLCELSSSLLTGFSSFTIIIIAVSIILVANTNIKIVGLLSVVLPAMVSFVTIAVEVPKLISRYLFNEMEEENMAKIIRDIQLYDITVRTGKYLDNNKIEENCKNTNNEIK